MTDQFKLTLVSQGKITLAVAYGTRLHEDGAYVTTANRERERKGGWKMKHSMVGICQDNVRRMAAVGSSSTMVSNVPDSCSHFFLKKAQ